MTARNTENLIGKTQAIARNKEKQALVLAHLREYTYSTLDVLCDVVSVKTSGGVSRLIQKLERLGLVKHKLLSLGAGQPIKVIGLTELGMGEAVNNLPDDDLRDRPLFRPDRVKLIQLAHTMATQRAAIQFTRRGYRVMSGTALRGFGQKGKVPDLVMRRDGETVAVEVELTVKSKKRYVDLMASYIDAFKLNKYETIIFVADSDAVLNRLKKRFSELTTEKEFFRTVRLPGGGTKLVPYKIDHAHIAKIRFTTFKNISSRQ